MKFIVETPQAKAPFYGESVRCAAAGGRATAALDAGDGTRTNEYTGKPLSAGSGMQMKSITADEYQRLRAGAEVLEADSFGEKVLRLADGTILKLFRRKRLLVFCAWYPYARRFADNAVAMRRRGIAVPEIIDIVRIPSIARDAVHYHPLPGESLRHLLRAGMDPDTRQTLRNAFTRFVIELHDKGVYFRSLHLGNVLHLPDGRFGLIDIADARLRPWRLGRHLRRRNLRLLLAAGGERELVDTAAVVAGRSAASG